MEQKIALLTICDGFAGFFLYIMVDGFYAAVGITVLCLAELIKIIAVVFDFFDGEQGPRKDLQMADQTLIKQRLSFNLIGKCLANDGEDVPDHTCRFHGYHHLLIDAGVDDVEGDEANFVIGYRHLQIPPDDTYCQTGQPIFLRIELLDFRQQGIAAEDALLFSFEGNADVIGQRQINAFIER